MLERNVSFETHVYRVPFYPLIFYRNIDDKF